MVQIQEPTKDYTIHVRYFENSPEPYLAYVNGYPGLVVQGRNIDDVMKEISISMRALEEYRKTLNK